MRSLLFLIWIVSNALAQQFVLENTGYLNLPDCTVANINMFSDSAIKAAMHEPSRLLYVAGDTCVHVVSVDDPTTPLRLKTQQFRDGSDGNLVDIAVCGDTLAILEESPFELTEGHVYLCDLYNNINDEIKCDHFNRITVGKSPKRLKYTSDCEKLLVTDEGRAGLVNGKFTDPDGAVTIINKNLALAGAPCTRELTFSYFNDAYASYIAAGVRWPFRGDPMNSIVTRFSQDIEPEAIAINDDNTRAYITLPENNALAVINLTNDTWLDMYSMGTKDWNMGLSMDASDLDGGNNLNHNYAVKGLRQPTDAVFIKGLSSDYVVTANTGAMKTYTMADHGVDYADHKRGQTALFDDDIDQPTNPPSLALDLSGNARLGRVHISIVDGISDITNLINEVHIFGGRDLSFWNPSTLSSSYDTMDDLERHASLSYPDVFNGDCSDASLTPSDERDSRSDDMGPEPNVLAAGHYNTVPIIAAATRNGLIYLYSLSINTPSFSSVFRLGNTTAIWGQAQGSSEAGDGMISDMGIISAQGVIGDEPYLYVISRGTGSVSLNRIHMV